MCTAQGLLKISSPQRKGRIAPRQLLEFDLLRALTMCSAQGLLKRG